MTVLLFHKRFAEGIRSGHKCQTIRPKRKRAIKVGDDLSCRMWLGVAYRSPQIELLATAAIGVFDVRVGKSWVETGRSGIFTPVFCLEDFARADGFAGWLDMLRWYQSPGGYGLPFEGDLIQWQPPQQFCDLCGQMIEADARNPLKGLCAECSSNLGGKAYSAAIAKQERRAMRQERGSR